MTEKETPKKVEAMALPQLLVLVDSEKKRPLLLGIRKIFSRFNEFWDHYGIFFVVGGVVANTVILVLAPNIVALICEIIYIPSFIFNIYETLTNKRGVGLVKDAGTGQPLDLVMVRVQKDNKMVQMRVTGRTGQFFIMLPPGSYEISITRLGYESQTQSLVIATGKQVRSVNTVIALKKSAQTAPTPPAPPITPAPQQKPK